MRIRLLLGILSLTFVACGGGTSAAPDSGLATDGGGSMDSARPRTDAGHDAGSVDAANPLTDPDAGPAAGNPAAPCAIPPEAGPEDVSSPDHVIGDGTPASCTGDAVIAAVALGGVITFDCGPDPITITLDRPAKVFTETP